MEFKSLEQIRDYIESHDSPLFVRWSVYPEKDIARGYSLNHQTGQAEAGLSVEQVGADNIAMQIRSYSYLPGRCWLLTGEIVSRGSDNEILVDNATFIGYVTDEAVEEAVSAGLDAQTKLILRWAKYYEGKLTGDVYIQQVARLARVWPEDVRRVLDSK